MFIAPLFQTKYSKGRTFTLQPCCDFIKKRAKMGEKITAEFRAWTDRENVARKSAGAGVRSNTSNLLSHMQPVKMEHIFFHLQTFCKMAQ